MVIENTCSEAGPRYNQAQDCATILSGEHAKYAGNNDIDKTRRRKKQ